MELFNFTAFIIDSYCSSIFGLIWKSSDGYKCPSVALMFQIGENATYSSVSQWLGLHVCSFNFSFYGHSEVLLLNVVFLDGRVQKVWSWMQQHKLSRPWGGHYALFNWKCHSRAVVWKQSNRQQGSNWSW